MEDYVGSTVVRRIRGAGWARAPWAKWRLPQKQVSDPPRSRGLWCRRCGKGEQERQRAGSEEQAGGLGKS